MHYLKKRSLNQPNFLDKSIFYEETILVKAEKIDDRFYFA
jgi:hypothetical protein